MVRIRVDVRFLEYRCLQRPRTLDGCVEIIDLEPQRQTIAKERDRITKMLVVVDLPRMKLQRDLAPRHHLLVLVTPMSAGAAEQLTVPAAACRDVAHADQRL